MSSRISAAGRRAGLELSGPSAQVGAAQALARASEGVPAIAAAGRWADPKMPVAYTRGEAAATSATARVVR